jgi:hypothetical protein
MLALQKNKPKSIVRSGIYRPKQLKFTEDISYSACVGYSKPKVNDPMEEHTEPVVATAETSVPANGTSSSSDGTHTETESSDMHLKSRKR